MLFNFHRRVAVLALVAGSSLVAACSDTTGAAPQPFPTAAPGTPAVAASFGTVPAGYSVSVTFPANEAPAGTTITGTATTTAPAGVTPLATKRQPQDIPTNHDTLLYICLTSSKTFSGGPSFGIGVPAAAAPDAFYLAEQTGATWNTSYAGPYDVATGTSTVTFDPSGPAPSFTLTAGIAECFGLVVGAPGTPTATPSPSAAPSATPSAGPTPSATPVGMTPTPSPSPSPTGAPTGAPTAAPSSSPTAQPTSNPTAGPTASPTPTAAPTATPTVSPSPTPVPAITAAPNELDLIGTGANFAMKTTISQAGSGGAITATSGCAPSTVTFSRTTSGDTATFTATGVSPGSCTETFTGIGGATATVAISVTTTSVGVSGRKRH